MKLVRFGAPGEERPGALDVEGRMRDLSGLVRDWSGSTLEPAILAQLERLDLDGFPLVKDSVRMGPCVGGSGKVICIGLNYADHAAETGVAPPIEPVIFLKPWSAVAGPNDEVWLPPDAEKVDWEVELGVIIGRTARRIPEAEALNHIAGYCVVNDLSERAWQLEGTGQWDKGKGADGFCPLGPWLATTNEVSDPQTLKLWLELNGTRTQDGCTKTMIFGVAALVSYVSRFMTLHAGDVISTGTPPGVGLGRKPPRYLRDGDEMRLGIDGLGVQTQRVRALT